MKKLLVFTFLLSSFTFAASPVKAPYGGTLFFKGDNEHQYSEFRDRTIWVTCTDMGDGSDCENFSTVVKLGNDNDVVSERSFTLKEAVDTKLENIMDFVSGNTSPVASVVLSLTGKSLYADVNPFVSLILIPGGIALDLIKAPITLPVAYAGKLYVNNMIKNYFAFLFDKSKKNKVKSILPRKVKDDSFDHITHEIKQGFEHELF